MPASFDDATVVALIEIAARASHISFRAFHSPKTLGEEMTAVQPRSVEQRVTTLEEQMLEKRDLPSRIAKLESQVLQLRKEIRNEFSAIRKECKTADDETRVFIRILYEDALARIQVIGETDDRDGEG